MHHALEIQEILSAIFPHCRYNVTVDTAFPGADLSALARTCRAFKEPALNVLWEELMDLSPVPRCLPEASHATLTESLDYAFSRPLTQTEWDTLRGYTRRIRAIESFGVGLDWNSVRTFLRPLTTESLFPNLRYLYCGCASETMPSVHLPLPSLTSLDFSFMLADAQFKELLELFPKIAPNIRRLAINVCPSDAAFNNAVSSHIVHWRNLQEVFCREVSLDANALVQLSQLPALARLFIELNATVPDQISLFDLPLTFSNLHELELYSLSLTSISKFLSRVRLPIIRAFAASIESCPSKEDVSSFFAGVGPTIQELRLVQWSRYANVHVSKDLKPLLVAEDLQPCLAYSHLRNMKIRIDWNAILTDDEMLVLVSTWPSLQSLIINEKMFDGGPRIVLAE